MRLDEQPGKLERTRGRGSAAQIFNRSIVETSLKNELYTSWPSLASPRVMIDNDTY